MKNTLSFVILFLLVAGVLHSCNTKTNTENKEERPIEEIPVYTLSPDMSMLRWTAYKTSQKLGVSGTFDSISIVCEKTTGTLEELLQNAKISIKTSSVNSNNEIRDPKIVAFFFGKFSVPEEISGSVDSAANGKAYISLMMNGINKRIVADYSIAGKMLNINTVLDLPGWNAESGLTALNKECEDLHKGEDGVSKLWPDVAIDIICPILEL